MKTIALFLLKRTLQAYRASYDAEMDTWIRTQNKAFRAEARKWAARIRQTKEAIKILEGVQ